MPLLEPTSFEIRPLIQQAEALADRVRVELPTHQGLQNAASLVVQAAQRAERVARAMKRPWSVHRLPVLFLALALLGLLGFLYVQFFHVSTLSLALPDRDAIALRERARHSPRFQFEFVDVEGSREAAERLERGTVDLGFIQGGVAVAPKLARFEMPAREVVLLFVRDGVSLSAVKRVLTSTAGEGSHAVAQLIFSVWSLDVQYLHQWRALTHDDTYQIPLEVDAVLVVKDPADEQALVGAERVVKAGFHVEEVSLGARAGRFDFLEATTLPVGHLQMTPAIPDRVVNTYSVSTFLVARAGLTTRQLMQAASLLRSAEDAQVAHGLEWDSAGVSELFQGVDAFLSILVNVGLAFLALLGFDLVTYRKEFHGLNTLVSLLSLLQANKDVLGVAPSIRQEHVLYLSLCSDLLSLIGSVSGYYTQENSSLLFNSLPQLVHQRCDALKINIQLKLLQSL